MKKKKWSLWMTAGLVLTGFIYFIFLNVKIQQYAQAKPPANADYLIVLGAKVNGNVPSLALKYRIEAAAQYMKENRKTAAIVSGGKGPGENRSEADAMKEGLLNLGIDPARIIIEDQSTSTNENIRNSKKLLPKDAKAGIIVTNDFHLYRAIMISKDYGLEVSGLPARTPSVIILKSYIREYLALSNFFVQRNTQQLK